MQQLTNPYTPNAGAEPPVIVGRDDLLNQFELLLARVAVGRTEQSMIITGLRGVGKTVLLGRFRTKALEKNWLVVELEASKHDDSHFRRTIASRLRRVLLELSPKARWTDRVRHAAAVLTSFSVSVDASGGTTFGLDVKPAEGFADHSNLALDLTDVFVAIGEAAQEAKRGVVLLIDELQFLSRTQLESIIEAMHKVVQRKLPITLVGAGLPQIAELAGDAKSYAERLFRFPTIGHLKAKEAKDALALPAKGEGVSFTNEALNLAVAMTDGYPYFLQELGYAVWTASPGPTINREDVESAIPDYEAKLDESFFRVRLDRTSELQRAYIRAMAQLGQGPQKASDVAAAMGRTSQNIAPTRAELINMGLLYTPDHGYAGFTVPQFDQFILRAIPELNVPKIKKRSKPRNPNH
jgi:hypothetical protein